MIWMLKTIFYVGLDDSDESIWDNPASLSHHNAIFILSLPIVYYNWGFFIRVQQWRDVISGCYEGSTRLQQDITELGYL